MEWSISKERCEISLEIVTQAYSGTDTAIAATSTLLHFAMSSPE